MYACDYLGVKTKIHLSGLDVTLVYPWQSFAPPHTFFVLCLNFDHHA